MDKTHRLVFSINVKLINGAWQFGCAHDDTASPAEDNNAPVLRRGGSPGLVGREFRLFYAEWMDYPPTCRRGLRHNGPRRKVQELG
jgi:hypothetical protein